MTQAVLSPEAQRALAGVLDEIIPPRADGSLPGAGGLGVAPGVEERLGDAVPLIAAGLAALDVQAADRGAPHYAALPAEARVPLLNEVAASHPGFLESLIFHSYATYYEDPRVMQALGLEPRPPHPKGYPLEPGDLRSLESVRARGKLYRDV